MPTFVASVMQTPALDHLEVTAQVSIEVDDAGWITSIAPADPDGDASSASADTVRLPEDQVLIPGLIDTHIHAPQFPQMGDGLDLPLEQWLFDYTFPLEASFADPDRAEAVWDALVPTLLANGTTSAVYYSSIHEDATQRLAAACQRFGQRAWVGRVAMDHPEGTPDWYRDATAGEGVAASARSIEAIRGLDPDGDLVRPIITPRFIPACSDELLAGLGALAAETDVIVQTHCSESDWAHGYVLDRHAMTDTESLDRFGLIRKSTVLAHAGHLTAPDMALIAGVDAGVSHCPHSNSFFGNAVFPFRQAVAAGVAVGLGTDIAGGPSPSIFDQITHAVAVSRMLNDGVDPALAAERRGVPGSNVDIVAAFWAATAGGAELLAQPIGLLAPGRRFDAVALQVPDVVKLRAGQSDSSRFEQIIRLADPSAVHSVWVNGRLVHSAD